MERGLPHSVVLSMKRRPRCFARLGVCSLLSCRHLDIFQLLRQSCALSLQHLILIATQCELCDALRRQRVSPRLNDHVPYWLHVHGLRRFECIGRAHGCSISAFDEDDPRILSEHDETPREHWMSNWPGRAELYPVGRGSEAHCRRKRRQRHQKKITE